LQYLLAILNFGPGKFLYAIFAQHIGNLMSGVGLDMIMVVDMTVRWEVGQVMVKKGLMADTWVVEADIKVVLQVHTQLLPMALF